MSYKMRNFPCTGRNWYVSGSYTDGSGGVLEWCNSLDDAIAVMVSIRKDDRFQNVAIGFEVW